MYVYTSKEIQFFVLTCLRVVRMQYACYRMNESKLGLCLSIGTCGVPITLYGTM